MPKRNDWPKHDDDEPPWALKVVPMPPKKEPVPEPPLPDGGSPPPCPLCGPQGGYWITVQGWRDGREAWAVCRCNNPNCGRGKWLRAKDKERHEKGY